METINVQESLAGRVALLHMSPLSQREIAGVETVPFALDLEARQAQQPLVAPGSTPQIFERIWKGDTHLWDASDIAIALMAQRGAKQVPERQRFNCLG